MKRKKPGKLKRRCYYDHANDRERHVWGRWYHRKFEKHRTCKRCVAEDWIVTDWTGLVGSTFKKHYRKLRRNVMMNNALWKSVTKQPPGAAKE